MSLRLKTKDIKNSYAKIISIGYCDAQNLLHYQNKVGAYMGGIIIFL